VQTIQDSGKKEIKNINAMEFSVRSAELTSLLEKKISNFFTSLKLDEIGRVVSVGDGICLVIQIATGVFLLHYTPHVDLAVGGCLFRSFVFLIVAYLHIFRGLYYASYSKFVRCLGVFGFSILALFSPFLFMDDLTRAAAQFLPSLMDESALGGMNGGFNPPPAPDPLTGFAAASHEADPEGSDPLFKRRRVDSIHIFRAPSPGGAVEVVEIPESPTSVSPPPQNQNPSIEEGDGVEVGRTILPLATEGPKSTKPFFVPEIPPYRGKDLAVQQPTGDLTPGDKVLYLGYGTKVITAFQSIYRDAFKGQGHAPSYERCRAAIAKKTSTFEGLLDLSRELVEGGPDGQVFQELLKLLKETKKHSRLNMTPI